MAYCTSADVENAVGGAAKLLQLADRDGNASADTDVVASAIEEASALIDSYAQKRFAVPFAEPTTTIKRLATRLARYTLREQRGSLTQPDVMAMERDTKWLEALAEGKVMPGGEVVSPKSPMVNDKVISATSTTAGFREVSRCKLKGFV